MRVGSSRVSAGTLSNAPPPVFERTREHETCGGAAFEGKDSKETIAVYQRRYRGSVPRAPEGRHPQHGRAAALDGEAARPGRDRAPADGGVADGGDPRMQRCSRCRRSRLPERRRPRGRGHAAPLVVPRGDRAQRQRGHPHRREPGRALAEAGLQPEGGRGRHPHARPRHPKGHRCASRSHAVGEGDGALRGDHGRAEGHPDRLDPHPLPPARATPAIARRSSPASSAAAPTCPSARASWPSSPRA
jgi:hypothetical protein